MTNVGEANVTDHTLTQRTAMPDKTTFTLSKPIHYWTIAGIVSAGARFIPVPFVDEMVQGRCRRYVVSQTLASQDSEVTVEQMSELYSDGGGCMSGCVGMLLRAPFKIVLFPIRKIVVVFTSVRCVPLEIMKTVLLGRTLERCLHDGRLNPTSLKNNEGASVPMQMRLAFDEAFTQMDWKTLRAAVKDALGLVGHWKEAAISAAKIVFKHREDQDGVMQPPAEVVESAGHIEEVFSRPETLKLFEEFDRRFDRSLEDLSTKDAS